MASKALILALRGLELLWIVLIIALIGNMMATAFAGNPSIVKYDMFVAVFGAFCFLYFIPSGLGYFEFPIVTIALDILNTLFFFCAAVATAAYLGAHSCSNGDYTKSNLVTNGSVNREKRCREAQASTAFLWFAWFCFTLSAIFTFMNRGTVNLGVPSGGSAMRQA